VLVSALIADGPPSRVIEEALDGRIEVVLPGLVLDELERVLTERVGFDRDRARAARDLLAGVATSCPGPPGPAEAITGDAADDEILASALEARVDALVTGDRRHLLPLGERHGARILTPQAALAELRAGD